MTADQIVERKQQKRVRIELKATNNERQNESKGQTGHRQGLGQGQGQDQGKPREGPPGPMRNER